jgi:Spy/CpxP family protein refolding chaperone
VSTLGALSDPRPTWHNPRILFVLCLVFFCGIGCGVFATHQVESRVASRSLVAWQNGGRQRSMEHLKQDLDLTPEQAVQIEGLLEDLAKFYDNLQGQMDDFRADGKERIRKVLTPEQQKKFEKLLNEMSTRIH